MHCVEVRWPLDLEQPFLAVLNLALLNALERGEQLGANWAWVLRSGRVGEFLSLRFQLNRFDGNNRSCGTTGQDLIEGLELLIWDLCSSVPLGKCAVGISYLS